MKFTSILSAIVAVAAVGPMVAEAAQNTTLSVLSNNVYFLSEVLYPNWGQRHRAQLIADSQYIKGHDVVVIQECFDTDPCTILRDGLRSQYPHMTPVVGQTRGGWDSTSGSYSSTASENGGVLIMSKWPIKQKHQFVYKYGCGADWFSNKGFAYVVLDYKGTNLHVFGTHLQSDASGCTSGQAARFRTSALEAWRGYINGRKIPANEPVIMAGDFNIIRDSSEYKSFLSTLQVNPPSAFTDKHHSQGIKSLTQSVLKLKTTPYELKGATYDDYSDHYPVQGLIELDI
ncbi:hypothetical protein BGW38_000770 [Lunasporangiospora selenospora]|uniref:sphingomyelin phosphodiesterase n=1 Tax=Lunasporangiospora selenospora TaxID=979761 RepID=A0A9P6FUD9_9FUNG|nr:hypothetical protein BGW38_000770 [Lunasporangiospora selenospora]